MKKRNYAVLLVVLILLAVASIPVIDHLASMQKQAPIKFGAVKKALKSAMKSEKIPEMDESNTVEVGMFRANCPEKPGFTGRPRLGRMKDGETPESICTYVPKPIVTTRIAQINGREVTISILPAKGDAKYVAISHAEGERNFYVVVRHGGQKTVRRIAYGSRFVRTLVDLHERRASCDGQSITIGWKSGEAILDCPDVKLAFLGEQRKRHNVMAKIQKGMRKFIKEHPYEAMAMMDKAAGSWGRDSYSRFERRTMYPSQPDGSNPPMDGGPSGPSVSPSNDGSVPSNPTEGPGGPF